MTGDPEDPEDGGTNPPRGADLVREALDRARADAAARREEIARSDRAGDSAKARDKRRGARSRLSRDGGDPVTFGAALESLIGDRGWQHEVAAGSVMGNWAALVGAEVARRATPVSLTAGVLTVQAESTAWATQLRSLAPQLLARLRTDDGPEVVTKLIIRGPTGPTWTHGPRRVRGEGPRDTYG